MRRTLPARLRWLTAMVLLASLSNVSPGAERDRSLLSDWKYAWPRAEQMVLDGEWSLACTDPPKEASLPKDLDKLEWIRTTVPTEVHWALYRAGKAPHPYVGLNAKSLRWIEDKSWWFRRRFVAPESWRGQQVRLVPDGVDYHGYYWLNGQYLGRSEGAFGAAKIGLANLRYGKGNDLVVRVDCGGYKLGRKGGAAPASLVKSELWSGWSQGATDLITVGIWQPVRLVPNGWPTLERPFVRTLELAGRSAKVRVTAEVCTLADEKAPCDVRATIRGKGFDAAPLSGSSRVVPLQGMVLADVDLVVPEPRLWWPNGLGDQPVYEAEIVLSRDGKTLDRLSVPFGIRTVERRPGAMQRTSYEMREWAFHVNGKPIFVKGTNWMPVDALADVSEEQYEWYLSMARDAGIQMIRVWGGGILEPDVFYELCDRFGIMVWQDFPLNCGWRAAKIHRTVWSNTAMWNIFRLRNHPSLVFWCGGNEFPPDDGANTDLVGILARQTRLLDGTRPFMAASPDEGDIHGYPQWDASWARTSELARGPFISEWGSHGMPSAQTYREIVAAKEANAAIGPTLLKMDEKLMQERFPEITHHWVEFHASRLPQMLSRGSAFDNLAKVPLERFTEAIAAGAAEFYKYSAEASRFAYPQNAGLLYWVWKRPWPIVGIQICDGLGQPLAVYYDVKRAYGSPWPCLFPPHLNYAPGDKVEMETAVLNEANRTNFKGLRLTARLIGPDLQQRQAWSDLAPVDVASGPLPVRGPSITFAVPDDFARSFFFVVLELADRDGRRLARNVYPLRCPPQLEDKAFREKYRSAPQQALMLSEGPWLRPQLEKQPTELTAKLVSAAQESPARASLVVEVRNTGRRPAVMTEVQAAGRVRYVADDALFWLAPGETRKIALRVRTDPGVKLTELSLVARAWNVAKPCTVPVHQGDGSP
jgi:beta-mannosidase